MRLTSQSENENAIQDIIYMDFIGGVFIINNVKGVIDIYLDSIDFIQPNNNIVGSLKIWYLKYKYDKIKFFYYHKLIID